MLWMILLRRLVVLNFPQPIYFNQNSPLRFSRDTSYHKILTAFDP